MMLPSVVITQENPIIHRSSQKAPSGLISPVVSSRRQSNARPAPIVPVATHGSRSSRRAPPAPHLDVASRGSHPSQRAPPISSGSAASASRRAVVVPSPGPVVPLAPIAAAPGPRGPLMAENVFARGMNNLGNTCYFSSIWQVMSHSPTFRAYLTEVRADSADPLSLAARRLVDAHWAADASPIDSGDLFRQFGAYEPHFFVIRQSQDAQEALAHVRSILNQAMVAQGYRRLDIFNTQIVSTKICRSDQTVSATREVIQELAVTVPRDDQPLNLMTLIRNYMRREFIPDAECPDGARGAYKQIRLGALPEMFVIQLKRYEQIVRDGRVIINKVRTVVNMPDELNLADMPGHPTNARYRLAGVVSHFGAFGGGHYSTDYLHPAANRWVGADDRLTVLRPGSPAPSGDSYLAFFERIAA